MIRHAVTPPIDVDAMRDLAATLPDDPRASVFAGSLQAQRIDATLAGSFDHLWMASGKHENTLEKRVRWPQLVEWRTSQAIERAYFWDAMPTWRLKLLLYGRIMVLWRGNTRQVSTRHRAAVASMR